MALRQEKIECAARENKLIDELQQVKTTLRREMEFNEYKEDQIHNINNQEKDNH